MAKIGVTATLDSKPFQASLAGMQAQVGKFARGITQIRNLIAGAFSVYQIARFGRSLMDRASDLSDFAEQTGLSTDALQALEAQGKQSGVALDTLRSGLLRLRNAQGEAGGKTDKFDEAMKALNMNAKEFAKMDTESALDAVATGFAKSGDRAAAFSALVDVFGRDAGPRMQQMLVEISQIGMPAFIQSQKDNNQVISTETLAQLDNLQDRLERIKTTLTVGLVNGWEIARDAMTAFFQAHMDFGGAKPGESRAEAMRRMFLELREQRKEANAEAIEKFKATHGGKYTPPALGGGPKRRDITIPEPTGDQFARIGGMLGGGGMSPQFRLAQKQLLLAEQQLDELQKIEKNTGEGGGLPA